MPAQTLSTRQLAALVEEGAIKKALVSATPGGFVIQINDDKLLEAKRGHIRCFKRLTAAASYLRVHGIGRFEVDVSRWLPEQRAVM
jgi:predicted transcriptional regulator